MARDLSSLANTEHRGNVALCGLRAAGAVLMAALVTTACRPSHRYTDGWRGLTGYRVVHALAEWPRPMPLPLDRHGRAAESRIDRHPDQHPQRHHHRYRA